MSSIGVVTVSISRVVMLMFCDHSQSGCRRWDALDYTVKKPSRFHICDGPGCLDSFRGGIS